MMAAPRSDSLPLAGIRVVAFEQAVALPFCTYILSELGADVVKIERPDSGDLIRSWDTSVRGLSSGFVWLNANKRDIAVDVANPQGRDIVLDLAADADVFLENFTPGVVARLGVSYDAVSARNPRIVYGSLSGYGQEGPFSGVKAYDLLMQGESGLLLANGYPDLPAKISIPVTDLIAGSTAAMGVLSSLFERQRTNEGRFLDVSMLDSVMPWLGYFPQRYWHMQEEPPRTGMRHQYIVPYGPYLAADNKYVNVVVATAAHWEVFCKDVIDRAEWTTDPRYQSIDARRDNSDQLNSELEAVFAARPRDEWLGRLADAKLPYGVVRTMSEVVEHPQLAFRQSFVEATSPVGRLPLVAFPLAPRDRQRHVPGLGEHTDILLGELGYSTADIAALRAGDVIA